MADHAVVAEEYRAVRSRAGAFRLARDFIRASGEDATSFLQGQLSQDLAPVKPGKSTWALLLSPQGKMVAFLRVLREADDSWVLESDPGSADGIIERLARFKLRAKCELEPLDWSCVALRGPGVRVVAPMARGSLVVADWPGLLGLDAVGDDVAPPEGVPWCSEDTYEVVRIEAGIPVFGRELDERTIPAEAGIVERSVSFDKGCYTGQELVARIDSRGGNVPRRLRGVVVRTDGGGAPDMVPEGAEVVDGDKAVGRVTSVAWSPSTQGPIALAYVKRSVEPPAEVSLRWEGGSASAQVVAFPITG